MAMELRVKATWMALWPWLVVIAILGVAKVPAFYVQPDDADTREIFEETSPELIGTSGNPGVDADGASVSPHRRAGGSMMPTERVRSDDERARHALSQNADKHAGAARVSAKGREVGLDQTLTAHKALRAYEPLRKMPPPDRRYWPTPNSQRAPRRPQAKKGSAK